LHGWAVSWLDQDEEQRGYSGLIENYDMRHCRKTVKIRVEAAGSGGSIAHGLLNCLSDGDLVL
jgi:hypothetical protein